MGARKKKVKILWHRVFFAFIIFIIIFWLIATLIGKLFGSSDKKPSDLNSYQVISESSSFAEPENTLNNNYNYAETEKGEIYAGNLILINNNIPFIAGNPEDTISVMNNKSKNYSVKNNEVLLKPEVITALNNMIDAFATEKGLTDIMVLSGFRTKEYQKKLYDEQLAKENATVSTLVAKPGNSEHHSGYAVDLALYQNKITKEFTGEGEYAWINQNSYRYGLVQRYKKEKASITEIDNEPWHFRYVGQPHAFIMEKNNFCFEEYIEYLKKFTFGKNHLQITNFDDVKYEIYYVPAEEDVTKVPLPKEKEYSVSGNNVDGFIVTVKV